ncbi:MAG TPA: hypothetical protein VMV93_10990 [Chloroflexota bacterium]|nr:hypothetical protein [Chloroflexota bacterium]
MAAEQQLPPERIKELATAAIVKRAQAPRAAEEAEHSPPRRPRRRGYGNRRALDALVKDLSEFYGFAAVPRNTSEHRLMADIVAENWVPLEEYERQVRYKDEALERVVELRAENADLRARIEQRIQEVPRLKAVIRAAVGRLMVDKTEKHIREEWASLLLRHIEAAREILQGELDPIDRRA